MNIVRPSADHRVTKLRRITERDWSISTLTLAHAFKRFHGPGYVLASGPSLNLGPEYLPSERCITVNYSLKKYPRSWFNAIMDPLWMDDLYDECRVIFTGVNGWSGDRVCTIPELSGVNFSENLFKGFHGNFTTTSLALHVASWMGFDPIVFLGFDLAATGEHFWGRDDKFYPVLESVSEDMRQAFDEIVPKVPATVLTNSPSYVPKGASYVDTIPL